MRLTRADVDATRIEHLAPLAQYPNDFLNRRHHYRFLACLAEHFKGARVIDIGTNYGDSALALSAGGGEVESFDVEDRTSGRPKPDNVRFHIANLYDPAIREDWKEKLLGSSIILIDTDPHEGVKELELVRWLQGLEYRGVIVLDDIWYFKPMRDNLWSQIHSDYKFDATELGNWSGTGIVNFNRPEIELRLDTENWTLVTGYFDLTGKPDATPDLQRKPSEWYVEAHGRGTMAAEVNLVVFCDPGFEDRIWTLRPRWLWPKTRVITIDFEEFPLTRYRSEILLNRRGGACSRNPHNTASYYLFCMARYDMIKRTIADNPFQSNRFGWINIHMEQTGWKNLSYLQEALSVQRDRFSTCFIDYIPPMQINDYFGPDGCAVNCQARASMCSGFFTGDALTMHDICTRMEDEFFRCLVAGKGHADEQLLLRVFYQAMHLFNWYPGDYGEMITNYARLRDRPEAPWQNLIRNSFQSGAKAICRRACTLALRGDLNDELRVSVTNVLESCQ